MDDIAEILRLVESLIRLGHVSAVDGTRVRITSGGIQTNWIPWITLSAGEDRDWHQPTIEEQVLLLCPGGDPANAVALRGLYSDANAAPSTNPAERIFLFRDGTSISYNTDTHHLQAVVIGSAGISTTGDLEAIVSGSAEIIVSDALTASAGSIDATSAGAATLSAVTASVTAPTITLNGAVTINGSLSLAGPLSAAPGAFGGGASIQGDVTIIGTVQATEVTADGISLKSHVHANPEGGTVGAPQ